jgi:DNA-binding CsgD family transcriptional regulator
MQGDIFATVEAIHAAGLDAALWPRAIELMTCSIGGVGGTLEVIDGQTRRHREFISQGLPTVAEMEYLDQYAALNVRILSDLTAKIGDISHDYAILDADAMARSPFYAEFLRRYDLRFFISGIVANSKQELAVVSVQRSARQGHVSNSEIGLMRRLLPHISQAFDVARRLKGATAASHALESALDWLADGVALLGADGAVLFANEGFHAIARRDDGLRLRKGGIEFAVSEARERLQSALAAAARLAGGDVRSTVTPDFTVPRRSGGEPYLVSVRPLLDRSHSRQSAKAVAIVFVRDPLARGAAAIGTLRDLFGLTEAEAALAQALQSGATVNDYARTRRLSLNTVYTHLRRLREKTGSNRLPELIHKLNELRLPLRAE